MKNNKGVTLVELIIAMALIFLVLPFAWDYINSSLLDSATINNKNMVQSSVNALMTQIQRDIQEARCPINPNSETYVDVKNDGFLICKPMVDGSYQSVLYEFNEAEKKVVVKMGIELVPPGIDETEYGIREENITVTEYVYIKNFNLTQVFDIDVDDEVYDDAKVNKVNNGVKVEIRGEIDEKSGYTLTNTYYTRNTIF